MNGRSDGQLRQLNDILAAEIRAECGRLNMRRTDLASAAGMSESYFFRRMGGYQSFTMSDIEKMAAVFDIDAREFLRRVTRVVGEEDTGALSFVEDVGTNVVSLDDARRKAAERIASDLVEGKIPSAMLKMSPEGSEYLRLTSAQDQDAEGSQETGDDDPA